jgi:DNA polymerase-3 subunit alpha
MHLVFIKRKLGQEQVTYPHPSLREVLEPTYGVITYQEQVMRIANVMAGFSLAEADVLRKAVGKKDAELIKQELTKFVERGVGLGHSPDLMQKLADQIETFGRYGFDKSHSVAYSISPTRRRGSRRTIRPSSWPRCCRRKSATPTRWCSTSTRPAISASRSCRPT